MARGEINPDRCTTGVATCFGVPTRDGQKPWYVEHFDLMLDLQEPVPLRLHHGPVIHSWGLSDNVGTVTRYAAVDYPVEGLLILAQVDEAYGVGDSVLRDITKG